MIFGLLSLAKLTQNGVLQTPSLKLFLKLLSLGSHCPMFALSLSLA
jgi:hypothetical protein